VLEPGAALADAARRIAGARGRRSTDVIVVDSIVEDEALADLNGRFRNEGIGFIRAAELEARALRALAEVLGAPGVRGISVIVDQAASPERFLIEAIDSLERDENARVYLRVVGPGLVGALLVAISAEKLTQLVQFRMTLHRLVASQA
jgi:hypothetical protein